MRETRRPQAEPLTTYEPPTRLIMALRWMLSSAINLMLGLFLAAVGLYLVWTVLPR